MVVSGVTFRQRSFAVTFANSFKVVIREQVDLYNCGVVYLKT